jgi:hypothetical protein
MWWQMRLEDSLNCLHLLRFSRINLFRYGMKLKAQKDATKHDFHPLSYTKLKAKMQVNPLLKKEF